MDSSGTFTYDSALPTPRDRMRHTLGDTDPTKPLRYDETYDAALAYYADEALATAKIGRALATQFGRNPTSVSVPGGPSVSYSDRVKTWLDTAKQLEDAVASTGGLGGSSYVEFTLSRPGMSDEAQQTEYRRSLDVTLEEPYW